MAYDNKFKKKFDGETVSTSLMVLTKFKAGDDKSKNRLLRMDGLNYGIYMSLNGQDEDGKFRVRLGGMYFKKEDFKALGRAFTESSTLYSEGKEFKVTLETQKGLFEIKAQKTSNGEALICGMTLKEKESGKSGTYYFSIRPSIEVDGNKISDAELELARLGALMVSIDISTNTIWGGHIERTFKAMNPDGGYKANKNPNGGSNTTPKSDSGDDFPF